MVRETRLSPGDLIHPFFVTTGNDRREAIASMPGQYRLSIDLLVKEAAATGLQRYELNLIDVFVIGHGFAIPHDDIGLGEREVEHVANDEFFASMTNAR